MNSAVMLGLIDICGQLIIAMMVVYPVILLFSAERKFRILGTAGCLLNLLTVFLLLLFFTNNVYEIAMMALACFYAINLYMVAVGKKLYRAMGLLWMILATVTVIAGNKIDNDKNVAYNKKRDCCITVLKNLEDAQNKYYAVNNKYAPDLKELAKYSELLCRKGDKTFCGLTEANKFRDACYDVDLTIENGKSNIEGRFEDTCDLGCLLRITSKGIDK